MHRVLGMWRALDERFASVEQQAWGAVVTDARFPVIWDVNYARLESGDDRIRLAEIDAALEPALERVKAVHRHVVVFRPDRLTDLLAEASSRGARLTWDLVMALDDRPDGVAAADVAVQEVDDPDDRFLEVVRGSLREFDVRDQIAADQLMRIEREVMLPAGKRWFRIGRPGGEMALGSLLPVADVGLVDDVVTLPVARGRGYANAVVRRIADEAFASGAETVVLLTDPGGRARRIYERIGFRALTTIASTVERR